MRICLFARIVSLLLAASTIASGVVMAIPTDPDASADLTVPVLPSPLCGTLERFSSADQFRAQIGRGSYQELYSEAVPAAAPPAMSTGFSGGSLGMSGSSSPAPPSAGSATQPFSGTNNQVAGVDEPDLVKTDGRYIYSAISGNETVIVRAYPPEESGVVARITTDGRISGIFVSGERLVVLEKVSANNSPYNYGYYPFYSYSQRTRVSLFDLSDPSSPQKLHTVSVNGSLTGARLVGNHLYAVISAPMVGTAGEAILPNVTIDADSHPLVYSDVNFFNGSNQTNQALVLLSLPVSGTGIAHYAAVASQASSLLYMSESNLHVVEASTYYRWSSPYGSVIHKFSFKDGVVCYVATGQVNGHVKDQFSLDEHNGYLRIATSGALRSGATAVHILDHAMVLVGTLDGLAPGETLHSARFMGDRLYLVTFKKIDPFFVIDLSDPRAPKMLGYLKIPGFSDYMHPVDANHILGIGKDTVEGATGNFAWFQGVKVSLFDVTDPDHPFESAKLVIGDRGTESEALYDHHSVLYLPDRGLLVMPVQLALINRCKSVIPLAANTYGEVVWRGAVVIAVDPAGSLTIRAKITHSDRGVPEPGRYSYFTSDAIRRSLTIGDFLYTISQGRVQVNRLDDFTDAGHATLSGVDHPLATPGSSHTSGSFFCRGSTERSGLMPPAVRTAARMAGLSSNPMALYGTLAAAWLLGGTAMAVFGVALERSKRPAPPPNRKGPQRKKESGRGGI